MGRYDLGPQTVRDALTLRTVAQLRGLAALIGEPGPRRKPELVDVLAGFLGDEANLRRWLDGMDELERLAVAEAVQDLDGRLDAGRFRAKYGARPRRGEGARLELLFLGPDGGIPADLRHRLAALAPEPPLATLASNAELPADDADALEVRVTEQAAAEDLAALLRLCEAGRLRCSDRTKRPTAATSKLIAEALANGELYGGRHGPVASFAWPLLLQAGGLAELAGTRLQLTNRGRKALAAPAHATLRQLWTRWVSSKLLDEFNRVEHVKGQSSRGGLTAAGPRRCVVAEALARCPTNRWVDVDAFFQHMRAEDLNPTVARDPWKLYLLDPQYGSLGYDGFHDWSLLQGRYVLCVIVEYAATLGLVDLAFEDPDGARTDYHDNWGADDLDHLSRYDGLRQFRVNELGAYALGSRDDYQPGHQAHSLAGQPALRVLANLEVVAMRTLPVADTLVLEAYAKRTGDTVWRLRRDRYLAAVAAGRPSDELARFLTARSHTQLPATVASFLDDTAANARRLRDLGPARVIDCEDPALAVLITTSPRLRDLSWRCGERHIIVPAAGEAQFRKHLHGLGYALPPRDADPAPSAGSP